MATRPNAIMKSLLRAHEIPSFPEASVIPAPLLYTIAKIAALWAVANWGYFLLFPIFGIDLSYNASPIPIAIYFLIWFIISVNVCWSEISSWLPTKNYAWTYGLQALVSALVIWIAVYAFSQLPVPSGKPLAPFTDILFATPWYFLPKAAEILVQQVLMVTLVLALMRAYRSVPVVMMNYALYFGGAHILLYMFSSAPTPYAAFMTIGALISALVVPPLILRVHGGALISYAIHILTYILIASTVNVYTPTLLI